MLQVHIAAMGWKVKHQLPCVMIDQQVQMQGRVCYGLKFA